MASNPSVLLRTKNPINNQTIRLTPTDKAWYLKILGGLYDYRGCNCMITQNTIPQNVRFPIVPIYREKQGRAN